MPQPRRAIVVITEGANPRLLKEWCDRGLLPAFAQLFSAGASGTLDSHVVPYEPPGLMGALTGHDPAEQGWFSYWSVHSSDYRPRPLTSHDLHVPFIWQRPDLASRTFGVINVFGTHPPLPLNGYLVSYPTLQTLRTSYPPDLIADLTRKDLALSHDVSVWFSGQARDPFVAAVVKADERRGRAALEFWRRGVECLVVNLTGIDRLSHCYWQELEGGSPVPLTDAAVFQAYRCCDRVLEQLIDALDEESSLLAFSEVGFGPLRAYCSINDHLAQADLLTWEDSRAGRIDWRRTVAFEAVQGSQGVNINLAGRYAEGTVAPYEYEGCRERVMTVLRQQINSYTGFPFIRDVLRREEVYTNGWQGAPDLIVQPRDERYLPFGDVYWARHVKRSLHSGWHRRGSYWAGIGSSFAAGRAARLLDVAPTIYEMLGERIPPDFEGRALGGVESGDAVGVRVPSAVALP